MPHVKKETSKKTVLIIEDDSLICNMYKSKLESEGFNVISANDGRDGLELAKTQHPDLILLDIMLPLIDGFSILKEITEGEDTKEIPVIIMTNLGTSEDVEKGKQLGAVDYIVKANLTPGQVIEKVKEYIK